MKKKTLWGFISVGLLAIWALFMRQLLLDIGLPDGSGLEALAEDIRTGQLGAAEAVAAFCREIISDGPH